MDTLTTKGARNAKGKRGLPKAEPAGTAAVLSDEQHPDFLNGIIDDPADDITAFTPNPEGPIPVPLPGPIPIPEPGPHLPIPLPGPFPGPHLPLRICGPVSGRYRYFRMQPPVPIEPLPANPDSAIILGTSLTVRVDVDRYYPQKRISIEAWRVFPRRQAHVIAEVTSDKCTGLFRRRIEGNITYRDGDATLIPDGKVIFEAKRGSRGFGYGSYKLSIVPPVGATRTYDLQFLAPEFDNVEFEVDRVANATPVVTSYDTGTHPNRPAALPVETLDLATTFRRAGFKVSMSPNTSTIPIADAGANGTWSDAEMHNAMVTYWSRFADKPQWAMWVLFAARHDQGRSLGGIMFDDIGPNHRQGTAIFTDSFIVDAPAGDPNPQAWINRMIYWTAVHEMGHAFNLAHAWQKTLGAPYGSPWVPLQNEENLRSFMNYPFRPPFNQQTFFSGFEFRFSDSEMLFMRHAPRRFVQMGNEAWFSNHGFEHPEKDPGRRFDLKIRPNRDVNTFSFLEPVKLELKLTNRSDETVSVEEDCVEDGSHVVILVKRDGGETKQWKPFVTHRHKTDMTELKPGQSLYGAHFVGASTSGWLIDEPGFYTVQAALQIGNELVVSDPLRIFVGTPDSKTEEMLAPDFFSEDVARVLAFNGAPALDKANDVLRKVVDQTKTNPAAAHAAVALGDPLKRNFKVLDAAPNGELTLKSIAAPESGALKQETAMLVNNADMAAQTMGHIDYRSTAEKLADALAEAGNKSAAIQVQQTLVDTMQKRGVLPSVVAASKRKLERLGSKQ